MWTCVAFGGEAGFADGPATQARFRFPAGMVADADGNVFIGDFGNVRVRKLGPASVTTVAGCGQAGWRDGPGLQAQFQFPGGVSLDPRCADGTALLISDYLGHCIRAIDPSGVVTTVAGVPGQSGHSDGPALQALFTNPTAVQVAPTGDLFVVERGNHCIRRIDQQGTVSTFCGGRRPGFRDGPASEAEFRMPMVIQIDRDGILWVSDTENHAIRRVDPEGTVTTVAGNGTPGFLDGQGTDARLNSPFSFVLDSNGDLVVADMENHCIRLVTRTGVVTTLLAPAPPSPSPPSAAAAASPASPVCPCSHPAGVVLTTFSELLINDFHGHQVFIVNVDRPAYQPQRRGFLCRVPTDLAAAKAAPPELEAFRLFVSTAEMRTPEHILGLLDLCRQFAVDDGYRRCLQYCRRNVSPVNAVRWLVEAYQRGLADATPWLLSYVTQQWDAIRGTAPQSFNLLQPYPELLEAAIPNHMRLLRARKTVLPPPKPTPQPTALPLVPSLCPHPVIAGVAPLPRPPP
eukprot:EG_transcript_5448